MLPLVGVALFLAAVVAVAEYLSRRFQSDSELTRKIVHISTGNVILLAWWFQIPPWVAIAASAIACLIALLSYFIPILPSINSVGRQSLGTFFYALSIGVLVAWFWSDDPQYTVIGILVMSWGDGMAGLIGRQFGQHPYRVLGITKSWEGSLAMAIASYLVCGLVLSTLTGWSWLPWGVALVVAPFSTALEAISKLGIDNLTVPLGSALLSFYLMQLSYTA